MPASSSASIRLPRWRIIFDGASVAEAVAEEMPVHVSVPWLAGDGCESLFPDAIPQRPDPEPGLKLYRAGELLVGHAHERWRGDDLAGQAERLYRRVLAACRGRHVYRIWNYVPRINGFTGGLEHYRAFCVGRSRAFEADFGETFQEQLSAASAVGCDGDQLDLVFAAGSVVPRHVENPEQVPAYLYPARHGPRAPSFARATVASIADRRLTFVSGTAAIKGHETVAPQTLGAQLDCTLDNLRLIARAADAGDRLGADRGWTRHFKVYLRAAADLPVVRAQLERELLEPTDRVTYLRADICRAELKVEIEATLFGAASGGTAAQ
jgi:hypothetical protein